MEETRILPPYATFYYPYNTNPSFNPIGYYMPVSTVYFANPNPNIQAINPSNVNPNQPLNPNQHLTLHGYGPMPREQRVRHHGPYARATAQSQPMLVPRVSTNPNPSTESSYARNHNLTSTWTLDYHKRLVDAVLMFGGIDEARAVSVWEYMNDISVSLYEVSTHIARLRVFLRNPEWLNADSTTTTTTNAEEELVPPTMPLLQRMEYNARKDDLFPMPPEPDLNDNIDLDSLCELKLGLPGNY